jgi:hypothetical protein
MPAKINLLPDQRELQRLLEYSVVTGKLYWRESRGSIAKGSEAGTVHSSGYICIRVNKKLHWTHRLIWKLVTGSNPLEQIDHIDRDPANNAWQNLREATNQQNSFNQGTYSNNTSGFKGVHWRPDCQKFRSRIKINGRDVHLGYFSTAEKASAAYRLATKKYFEEFARYE